MQTNEEPERQNNPKKIIEAILDPSPLTLAHVVMLEKISSPLLYGDSSNTEKNLQSMVLLELPIKDALAKIKAGLPSSKIQAYNEWLREMPPYRQGNPKIESLNGLTFQKIVENRDFTNGQNPALQNK